MSGFSIPVAQAEPLDLCNSNYGMRKFKNACTYTIEAEMHFGKYKTNLLKYVFKVDPEYIEWCIINSQGFVIHPEELTKLMNQTVFNCDDLRKYLECQDGKETIDLSSFEGEDFPKNAEVREWPYKFSQLAIDENNRKLSMSIDSKGAFTGGKWENRSGFTRTNSIKIVPPKK